ncbi:Outer membrane protein beta-barrel domain-containing protein [Prevotella sp. tc2-28]|uniref:porin family protein n=1 Tax=Prevotella sp. tc2-28 TaxID=1761888 RepID=UPI00089D478F|nr:porin family protein [Prevotella sp. tc2-28]SEA59623.1 Outer membrane protein beta-barrel domain-containing protein [Prevotella sp. tc2-28]
MKKILMLLFAAVALSLPSQAQVKFGLKGGLNLTNLSLSESIGNNLKSKEGFHIGPTVKIGLPVPGLSVDASALYDQRSAKVSVTRRVSGAEVESTLKSQSLQVPINIRYAVGLGSVANLFAFAGPQFGFNLGDKNKKILDDAANWTLRSSNVSANLGIGTTILDHLQITANYNFALGKTGEVELWDATKQTWNAFTDGKASSWQISAAYFF